VASNKEPEEPVAEEPVPKTTTPEDKESPTTEDNTETDWPIISVELSPIIDTFEPEKDNEPPSTADEPAATETEPPDAATEIEPPTPASDAPLRRESEEPRTDTPA
jgi:hypothetical protein